MPGIYFYHLLNIDNILPLSKISFEGKMFNCPHNVNAYLTEYYGDFMKIPPVEKRAIHASKIEFND
jgi:lipopolysaccharide cholinephosphotransferase